MNNLQKELKYRCSNIKSTKGFFSHLSGSKYFQGWTFSATHGKFQVCGHKFLRNYSSPLTGLKRMVRKSVHRRSLLNWLCAYQKVHTIRSMFLYWALSPQYALVRWLISPFFSLLERNILKVDRDQGSLKMVSRRSCTVMANVIL